MNYFMDTAVLAVICEQIMKITEFMNRMSAECKIRITDVKDLSLAY